MGFRQRILEITLKVVRRMCFYILARSRAGSPTALGGRKREREREREREGERERERDELCP